MQVNLCDGEAVHYSLSLAIQREKRGIWCSWWYQRRRYARRYAGQRNTVGSHRPAREPSGPYHARSPSRPPFIQHRLCSACSAAAYRWRPAEAGASGRQLRCRGAVAGCRRLSYGGMLACVVAANHADEPVSQVGRCNIEYSIVGSGYVTLIALASCGLRQFAAGPPGTPGEHAASVHHQECLWPVDWPQERSKTAFHERRCAPDGSQG